MGVGVGGYSSRFYISVAFASGRTQVCLSACEIFLKDMNKVDWYC